MYLFDYYTINTSSLSPQFLTYAVNSSFSFPRPTLFSRVVLGVEKYASQRHQTENAMIDNVILQAVKEVPIPRILADLGIRPCSDKSMECKKLLYLATYRGEQHPSLSVFMKRDSAQWVFKDHATGEVGTNLDLLVRFGFFSDWRKAAAYVAQKYLGIDIDNPKSVVPRNLSIIPHQTPSKPYASHTGVIHGTFPVTGSPAEKYITDTRKIPITVASQHVCFARYSYHPNGRVFTGIAWPTCRGGWSIRWPIDLEPGKGKAFVGPGGVSFFPLVNGSQSETCMIFEGIFDYLTQVTLHGSTCDAIVLNSVDNVDEAFGLMDSYQHVIGYLDTDVFGRKCWEKIASHYGKRAIDASFEFAGFKDFNDFLKSLQNSEDVVHKRIK